MTNTTGVLKLSAFNFKLLDQEKVSLNAVQKILGYKFKNEFLLLEALTHRSFINTLKKFKRPIYSYERLEFLGDSLVDFYVTEYLYKKFPDFSEGIMSKIRSKVVSTESLAELLKQKGINNYIIMSFSEEEDKGFEKPIILAAVFESITGALYVDGGHKVSFKWVSTQLFPKVDEIVQKGDFTDPKTALQELSQRMWKELPVYEVVEEIDKSGATSYTVRVKIHGEQVAQGSGSSKKKAEHQAALRALNKIKRTTNAKN